jgi:hypothetical protein
MVEDVEPCFAVTYVAQRTAYVLALDYYDPLAPDPVGRASITVANFLIENAPPVDC